MNHMSSPFLLLMNFSKLVIRKWLVMWEKIRHWSSHLTILPGLLLLQCLFPSIPPLYPLIPSIFYPFLVLTFIFEMTNIFFLLENSAWRKEQREFIIRGMHQNSYLLFIEVIVTTIIIMTVCSFRHFHFHHYYTIIIKFPLVIVHFSSPLFRSISP